MSKPKVIVTRRWPHEVEQRLGDHFDVTLNEADRPYEQQELRQALLLADAVLPTVTDRLGADLFAGGVRARILGNFGVGFNHIDIAAASAAGLIVTNTPAVLTDATADLAMTLLLMCARRAGEGERELRSGKWTGWRPTHLCGTQVSGKTVGIIGMGRIGQAMARRCHFGFGMEVVFFDSQPVPHPGMPARQLATVDEVLAASDFVSLHCPGGGENTRLINERRLARMKKSAFLINTARGDVVDEDALVQALRERRITGAGLDVFETEPSVPRALTEREDVVLLPHLGSATSETRIAMGMRVIDNLSAFFEGRTPPDAVN
ncbi:MULTISPECIES: 2-hydroxyacid dehydrogenase [Mesorhizobium]|uniref:D-glycerate dehydrogenase n=5 Tax=Mesorhizobium TaxID=68287 RepID=A0AB38TGM2_9HYPH|nr:MULTISPECIES: D-glycerate dehydrogenase [Mesorhizobium]ARP67683.1 D-glycerate dehydrogenase [Mesorhizobium sp. WSM1497]MDF3218157.1 D-glycerate dehydrogenase [Mesorhizobium ciceri]RUZ04713.1 D-glycerate dehydrogenase [Mesorhizobium sp. M7A.F.Ca.CA.001.04.2.1]RUZ42886.1 D-glycerate dehydrogenase [Mesorhizobium sp. M7A.F.Ca.CA.001.15.1.1]RVA68023.1 D-glycerate dehydrogenase [Mesorhizobium sp. M7A.F.Ca.CA.001.08.1.1]